MLERPDLPNLSLSNAGHLKFANKYRIFTHYRKPKHLGIISKCSALADETRVQVSVFTRLTRQMSYAKNYIT